MGDAIVLAVAAPVVAALVLIGLELLTMRLDTRRYRRDRARLARIAEDARADVAARVGLR